MADISKIVLGGNTYNIKDTVARAAAVGGMHFLGVSLSEIADGTANVAIIKTNSGTNTANRYYTGTAPTGTTGTYSGVTYTLKNVALIAGDVVIYGRMEFVFSTSDNCWHELGSTGILGKLAYKDGVSVTYKKATGGTLVGTKATITSVCTGTDKKVSVSASGEYTPAGTISGDVTNGTPGKTTVVRSVDTSKLKTISLRGVSGTTTAVNASYKDETLTLSAVTAATANATATTVATGSVDSTGTGSTVATGVSNDNYVNAITSLGTPSFSGSFSGTAATVSVTGTTDAIEVAGTYTPAGSVTITNTDTTVTGS